MLSTLLGLTLEAQPGPPSNCTVGLCWPYMLGQRWANVVYRTTTVGPSLGQHCHFRWANVGNTTLAQRVVYTLGSSLGQLYTIQITWVYLNTTVVVFNIAWPTKLIYKKNDVNTYFWINITFNRLIYVYSDLQVLIHYN